MFLRLSAPRELVAEPIVVLVVDASVVLTACLSQEGFGPLAVEPLVAPPLMWSEVNSVLHELQWRGAVTPQLASMGRDRLLTCPVGVRSPRGLTGRAWSVADELGWAKTYDAEYVALARLLNCRLVTTDARLRRGARRLVSVVGPTELGDPSI